MYFVVTLLQRSGSAEEHEAHPHSHNHITVTQDTGLRTERRSIYTCAVSRAGILQDKFIATLPHATMPPGHPRVGQNHITGGIAPHRQSVVDRHRPHTRILAPSESRTRPLVRTGAQATPLPAPIWRKLHASPPRRRHPRSRGPIKLPREKPVSFAMSPVTTNARESTIPDAGAHAATIGAIMNGKKHHYFPPVLLR